MNTRQLLSVGIDIGTTTTQVIFSHLELVNRAAVSQVPRYEFIKREISWQSPVFFKIGRASCRERVYVLV